MVGVVHIRAHTKTNLVGRTAAGLRVPGPPQRAPCTGTVVPIAVEARRCLRDPLAALTCVDAVMHPRATCQGVLTGVGTRRTTSSRADATERHRGPEFRSRTLFERGGTQAPPEVHQGCRKAEAVGGADRQRDGQRHGTKGQDKSTESARTRRNGSQDGSTTTSTRTRDEPMCDPRARAERSEATLIPTPPADADRRPADTGTRTEAIAHLAVGVSGCDQISPSFIAT